MRAIRGQLDPAPVVGISGQVTAGGEQGLLGLAFSPDGRYLYLHYTDQENDPQITELAMAGQADPGSQRSVLQIEDPFGNHNGSQLTFGPTTTTSTSPSATAAAVTPWAAASRSAPCSARSSASTRRPGAAPTGCRPTTRSWSATAPDPRSGTTGCATRGASRSTPPPEDLWIGDVGQNAYEEVDVEPAGSGGRNCNWNRREGRHPYGGGDRPDGPSTR